MSRFRSSYRDRKITDAEVAQYRALLDAAQTMFDKQDGVKTSVYVPTESWSLSSVTATLQVHFESLGADESKNVIYVRRHNHRGWGLMVEVSWGYNKDDQERKTLAKANVDWIVGTVNKHAVQIEAARKREAENRRIAHERVASATNDLGFDYQQHYSSRLKLQLRYDDQGALSYQGTIEFGQYDQPKVSAQQLTQALAILGVVPVSERKKRAEEARERAEREARDAEWRRQEEARQTREREEREALDAQRREEAIARGVEI